MSKITCKLCSGESKFLFKKNVLNKYSVEYFQCSQCRFVQTTDPYWLQESYENAITSLDIGMISRNNYLSAIVKAVINCFFDNRKKFIDFGGGYGILVRLMRDSGFDYYRQDKFCENLFSKGFDVSNLEGETNFELLTAFEVFEHLPEPVDEVAEMLKFSDSILFSTDLQPETNLSNWEYLVPEVGQHVALYHYKSLQALAQRLGLNLYSNKRNIHLLTRRRLNGSMFKAITHYKAAVLYNSIFSGSRSLLQQDYQMLKRTLNKGQEHV